MGRTKLGNANAQRNNNAKKKNGFNTEFATESYSQMGSRKINLKQKTAPKIETASLDAVFIIFAPVVQ